MNLRLNTVIVLVSLFVCLTSNAQLAWEFVNELEDGAGISVNTVKSDDANACVYVGGHFSGDLSTIFTTGLNGTPNFSTNNGAEDGFVAKYLEDGTLVWAFMVGGAGNDDVVDIDVDASGSIYITGSFDSSGEFRGTELTSYPNLTAFGGIDIFQAKFDADGKHLWLHEDGGAGTDVGTDVQVLGSSVYFAGIYVVSGFTEIGGFNPITYGGEDIFVLRRDLSGNTLWYMDGGSNSDDQIGGIVPISDSVYVSINFSGASMTYIDAGSNVTPAQPNSDVGSFDISIIALAANTGNYSWTNQISGANDELCTDMIGNVFDLILTGSYNTAIVPPAMAAGPANLSDDIFVLSLKNDLGNGQWLVVEPNIGASNSTGTSVSFDQAGDVWIAAEFQGTLNVDGLFPETSLGGIDLATIHYDIGGNYQEHYIASGTSDLNVNDLTIDTNDEVYFGGSSLSNSTFGLITTTYTGPLDGYFAKLGFCDASFSYASSAYCSGNANPIASITGDNGGSFSEVSGSIVFADASTGEIDLTLSTVGGPYTITYMAPGGCAQTFDVTIDPNANPTFTSCPGNIVSANDAGLCSAIVTYSAPTAIDDCGSVVITQTDGSGFSSGDPFPVGITNIEYTATDQAGNTSLCSFSVTVSDTELPVISCPANISQGTDVGVCGASVVYSAPTGTDNCPGATTTQIAGLASGSTFPIGTTTNTFRVTDGAGNFFDCSFDVTITDTESPAITCPVDMTVNNDAGQCDAVVTFIPPIGTDNCPGSVTTQSTGLASGSNFPVGTTVNTFIVTDAAGNSTSCSFNITVVDSEAPSINCPNDTSIVNDLGDCGAIFNYSNPIGVDNCTSASTSMISGLASGSYFPLGLTTNVFEVVDLAGNSATCSFDVIVVDMEPPSISCTANISQNNDLGGCDAIVTYTAPTSSDNCSSSIAQIAGLASGSSFPVGITQNTFVATDLAGNTDTCTFQIEILDAENPSITCPFPISKDAHPDSCGALVQFAEPVGIDNCPASTTILIFGLPDSSVFPIGTTWNTYQVMDAAGNITTCSFQVTISDTTKPVFDCPSDTTIYNELDTCGSHFSFGIPIAYDSCLIDTSSYSQTFGPTDGAFLNIGTHTLGFSVSDTNANIGTCSYNIIVADTSMPTAVCPGNMVSCDSVINWDFMEDDNCVSGIVINQLDASGFTLGDTFPVGITNQLYEIADFSGNTVSCSFTVEVLTPVYPYWDTLINSVCLAGDTIDLSSLIVFSGGAFSGNGVSGSNFIVNDAGIGSHDLTYQVSNSTCAADSTQTIQVLAAPTANAGLDDSICGVNYNLVGVSTYSGYWQSTTCAFADSTDLNSTVIAPSFGWHQLIWNSPGPLTCETSDTLNIRFDEQGYADAGEDFYVFESLDAFVSAAPISFGTGYWDIVSGSGSFLNNQANETVFTGQDYGNFVLEWVVENGSCPPASDQINVELRELILPEGISPNDDGMNDLFEIPGIYEFQKRELVVFDRWGKLVYQNQDYQNEWNGINIAGENIIDDTYFYELVLDEFSFNGFIVVKRE